MDPIFYVFKSKASHRGYRHYAAENRARHASMLKRHGIIINKGKKPAAKKPVAKKPVA